MLCEKCKIREANIKYTEVINGVKTEHNLCSQCASETDFGQYGALLDGEFSLGRLLSGLLGLTSASPRQQTMQDVACPNCKTTYEEFVANSCFGCADCYHVFDLLIGEQIKKLQENSSHTGKTPKSLAKIRSVSRVRKDGTMELTREEQIKDWERRLSEALKTEEYEEAAVCRDKLKDLRKGTDGDDEVV